jgi:Plasmid pRiA4b ORF-3-like protein
MSQSNRKRNCVYTLHIALDPDDIQPVVWRRLDVDGKVSLGKLHHFIQAAFGWHDAHLHEFNVMSLRFGDPADDELAVDGDEPLHDESKAILNTILEGVDEFSYLYDFGDSWEHVITVESVKQMKDDHYLEAFVLGGENACPPEDVGGSPGYQSFVEAIMTKPNSKEGREWLDWVGCAFHPLQWDIRAANAAIIRLLYNGWGGK